jgi:putative transposase
LILSERHIITKNNPQWKIIDQLCFFSKNLYNSAIYEIKQHYLETGRFLRYKHIEKLLKRKEEYNDYYTLPPATSQQILMVLDRNIKSYFGLLKKWKKNKKTLSGCPKFPKYKDKLKGRNLLIFRADCARFNNGFIRFPKKTGLKPIRTLILKKTLKQVRIVPKSSHYIIEIIYEVKEKKIRKTDGKAFIDLGVNNLAALTTNVSDNPILINGRPLKSINQYYNKKRAKLQSDLKIKHNKFSSNRTGKLTLKRNNKIKDYLHKASRFIVNYCIEKEISELVLGHSKEWKQGVNIGKRNNQIFVDIPFDFFIRCLEYKCKLEGIKFIKREESYTSKCSFLDLEKIEKKEEYLGKRVKRGLFRSSEGILINADVNGSLNIGRKEFGDAVMPTNRGFVVNPVKVNFNQQESLKIANEF